MMASLCKLLFMVLISATNSKSKDVLQNKSTLGKRTNNSKLTPFDIVFTLDLENKSSLSGTHSVANFFYEDKPNVLHEISKRGAKSQARTVDNRVNGNETTSNGIMFPTVSYALACPVQCTCKGHPRAVHMSCREATLIDMPRNMSAFTRILDLSQNKIHDLPEYAFSKLKFLEDLSLADNFLQALPGNCFAGVLHTFHTLNLENNLLRNIPNEAFRHLQFINSIQLRGNLISYIADTSFAFTHNLLHLNLDSNRLKSIDSNAFRNLTNLHTLILSRNQLSSLSEELLTSLTKLDMLDLQANFIDDIPNLRNCTSLVSLNLNHNRVSRVLDFSFGNQLSMRDLLIGYNRIQEIGRHTFVGLSSLQYLDLQHNRIQFIHTDALLPTTALETLNINDNKLKWLPNAGLSNLYTFRAHNNPGLRKLLPPAALPRLLSLTAPYAYHCCDYIQLNKERRNIPRQLSLTDKTVTETITFVGPHHLFERYNLSEQLSYDDVLELSDASDVQFSPQVECSPLPDPFQPCVDLMGWWFTRCGVWFVLITAIIGNASVLIVTAVSRQLAVTRFLACNLAISDLSMGLYLGILAYTDSRTFGDFKSQAVTWQLSIGCKVAGALAVFASELSVFTLNVITIERLFAITYTVNSEKRLSLSQSAWIMAVGWLLALLLAILPLLGVSDYRKYALCLPFQVTDEASLSYVLFLLLFNTSSFLFVTLCYTCIYARIRKSAVWACHDSRIASRMAVLVFTNIACWGPVCGIGLSAALGRPVVGLEAGKVLVVFVLPLNACLNPLLYTLMTKQFQQDCAQVCSHLECEKQQVKRMRQRTSRLAFHSEEDRRLVEPVSSAYSRGDSANSTHSARTLSSSLSFDSRQSSRIHQSLNRHMSRSQSPPPQVPPRQVLQHSKSKIASMSQQHTSPDPQTQSGIQSQTELSVHL